MSQEWAAKELAGIDLGDARLNQRSLTLLDRLADKPTASIPHACNGWAETQAAYRFLAQEDIGWKDILAPHFTCTQQRMQGRPVVLCIQDTTELDFHGQQTEGLGTLSFAAQRGMYLHPTYAVSPEREPIPKQPPSLNTVVRLIASFGGFLGRKGDGEPGVKTIWTGLQMVMDFAAGIRAYKAGEICV